MSFRFACLATLAPVVAALPAFAQDAEDQSRVEDTIVVSAPGPDRSADELIGNASVLLREDVLETLEGSLGDTLIREPGVSSTYFGPGASRPVVRGLGSERVLVLTNGIGVIDVSAASPDHQVAADGIDAKRIEILRGPAALAYGGQAIGGVVNVIDGLIVETLPEKPFTGDVYGAHNSVNSGVEGAAAGQITVGDFVFALSASARDFDPMDIPGYAESDLQRALEEEEHEEHEEGEEEGEEHEHEEEEEHAFGVLPNSFVETQTLGAGLSWVGETAFFGVSVRDTQSEYGLIGHSHHHHEDEDHEDEDHDEDENDHEDEDHDEHEGEEEAPIIDLSHTRFDLRGGVTFEDAFLTKALLTASFVDYEHTEFEGPGEVGTTYAAEGHEIRAEVDHRAVLGFEGAFGFVTSDRSFEAVGEEAFLSPTDTNAIGVFLYEAAEFDNGAGVEGGLRFESVEVDNLIQGDKDFNLFSGSLGAHRHFNNGVFVGAQYSYTERAPSDVELFADGPHLATQQFEIGDANLSEEKGQNVEATVRWSNEKFSVGANVFRSDFDDFIFLSPTGAEEDELAVFEFTQSDAEFIGGEIFAEAQVGTFASADWSLEACIDWVNAEFDGGANVPYIPPVSAHANVKADWGLLSAKAEVEWADDQDDFGAGQLPTDGYTLLNLSADFDLGSVNTDLDGAKVFVQARNVTDEEARVATSVLKDLAPLPGRNIKVGVRYAF